MTDYIEEELLRQAALWLALYTSISAPTVLETDTVPRRKTLGVPSSVNTAEDGSSVQAAPEYSVSAWQETIQSLVRRREQESTAVPLAGQYLPNHWTGETAVSYAPTRYGTTLNQPLPPDMSTNQDLSSLGIVTRHPYGESGTLPISSDWTSVDTEEPSARYRLIPDTMAHEPYRATFSREPLSIAQTLSGHTLADGTAQTTYRQSSGAEDGTAALLKRAAPDYHAYVPYQVTDIPAQPEKHSFSGEIRNSVRYQADSSNAVETMVSDPLPTAWNPSEEADYTSTFSQAIERDARRYDGGYRLY